MKTPDTIYARIYPVDNELRQEWSSAPMYGVETTEYIRKESLLDWMSSKMKIAEMIIGTDTWKQ